MILSTMRAAKRERRLRLFLEMAPLVKNSRKRASKASSKSSVTKETPTVAALQAKASVGERVKHHIPQADLLLLAELVRRHSADYEAMSLDRRNAYQLTPGQLRQRIARMSRQFPDVWQKYAAV
ncbi:hypothetical protein BOX15_Mlig007216g1 [Macrostomum lignano]|uniref:Nucleolar protein 16 n=1 Tax=Macrostomum lignano TaxID=282301 RepID=A0A267DEY4_9PLAT|nr:hypothetical protein BOX15_Mlig007216g1 [Macrostomum lignano]